MLGAGKIHLINWSITISPFVKLQPATLGWKLMDAANERQADQEVSYEM